MSRIFGPIRQNGYVVRDIEAALKHWTTVLGVGPFFYVERARIADLQYKGKPSAAEVHVALANSGNLQIELLQPCNDAPSMWRDFLVAGHEGTQARSWSCQKLVAQRRSSSSASRKQLRDGMEKILSGVCSDYQCATQH